MRKISLDHIQDGMKLAKSIYTQDGRILLGSGIELKEPYVARLRSSNISEIYIEDDLSGGIHIHDVISEEARIETRALVKNMMESFRINRYYDSCRMQEMVAHIIDELISQEDIIVNLSDIRSVDDYTFAHSVSVCVLALITGISLDLTREKLKDLGIGALLHDIGKIAISEEILKKPSELSIEEFSQIKLHTTFGYDLVKANTNISADSATIVLQHHERYDGSGYPAGLRGDEIHLFARITAIADVYDALTSDRVYRSRIKSSKVIEYLTHLGVTHFDQEILEVFLKNVAIYPQGTGVLLNSGEKAIVVKNNKKFPTKPWVRVIYNSDGIKESNFEDIDLTKVLNLAIVDVCDF